MKPDTDKNKNRKQKSKKAFLNGIRLLGYSILGIFSLSLFYGSDSLFAINDGLSHDVSLGMTASSVAGIVAGALMITYVNLRLKKLKRAQS